MSDHSEFSPAPAPPVPPSTPLVKIIGVGSAGINMIGMLDQAAFAAAQFIAINTDAAAFADCPAPVKIHIETKLLRGLGTGGDPERARALAEDQFATLKSACEGASVVFIVAGLGGGAGSGICPVLARAAREAGALVLAFVTLPFACECNRRESQARQSMGLLKTAADGVICLDCERFSTLLDKNDYALDVFRATDRFLVEGLSGVWSLLMRPGIIQVHFGEVCALLRNRHTENGFACVKASGPGRAREIIENLMSHPLLDEGRAMAEATTVLVWLISAADLSMAEINRVIDQIKRQCHRAEIIMGAAVDPDLRDELRVTVITARPEEPPAGGKPQTETRTAGGLPGAREVVVAQQTHRIRKAVHKPVQGQLPLTILSRGRFDKSEPTRHNGEDLDVPTFIRHGVTLN